MQNSSPKQKRWIVPYFPRSIFMRFLLIIVIPTIVAQLVAIYIFYERHWSTVSDRLDLALANEIGLLVSSTDPLAPINDENPRSPIHLARRYLQFIVSFIDQGTLPPHPVTTLENYKGFSNYLHETLNYPYHLYHTNKRRSIAIDVQLPNGVLHIATTRKRLATPTTYIFILWMTGTTLMLLMISIIFMRNQIRPIIRLARAADKFGKGQPVVKLRLEGATEIRKATAAFLEMKTRIDRLVSQRADMLAGVSHDLRTPITRMKLQLAMAPSSQEVEDLKQDISEMETMIHGYLDFAKDGTSTANATIDVSDFMVALTASYRTDAHRIHLAIPANITITINPDYFSRMIGNLFDNALRYAKELFVTASTSDGHLMLVLDDDGPGIPTHEWEEVFRPFYRLDKSRNLETGGVGLGLAVVRDLVAQCGGEIALSTSPQGGLRATVTLPL